MKRTAVLLIITLWCIRAAADTLWLKNGTAIKVNKAVYKGDQVEYVVGLTTYYMPASQVDRIEKNQSFGVAVSTVGPDRGSFSGPAVSTPSRESSSTGQQTRRAAPSHAGITVVGADAVLKRILVYDHVDDRALQIIESEGNSSASAAAYATAANYEYAKDNDLDRARAYAKHALDFAPNTPALLSFYSSLLLDAGENDEAVARAEKAAKLAPESADILYQLGTVYYVTNRLSEAIAAWKRSLAIHPDEGLRQYLAKAEREVAVEDKFNERGSSHFTIRFEGQRTGFTLAGDVLHTLEEQFAELSRDFSYTPQQSISVVLYTEQEYFDVTLSPSWSAALNDVKLRIPVKNVTALSPQFQSTLKHELTHSFVHFMTHGNCPTWLNEGLAQLEQGRRPEYFEPGLARLFREGKQVPVAALQGSFSRFDEQRAEIAYAESLVLVAQLESAYGVPLIRRILEQLGTGEAPEEAVRDVIHKDYAQLERELGDSLTSKYSTR